MRIPNLYDAVNLVASLFERAKALVLRRPYDPTVSDHRAGIYARAQKRYEYIVQGGDLVNLAPVQANEPLFYVKPEDHLELLAKGVIERDGKWYLQETLTDEERWAFAKWFPRAAPDLETKGSNWQRTVDGRSTNGYIRPDDLFRGWDSTATSLVMGAFPVIFAAAYALFQIPVLGPGLAVVICGPLLLLHMYVLYQAESAGTVAKLLFVSGVIPMLLGGMASVSQIPGLAEIGGLQLLMQAGGIGLVVLLLVAFAMRGSEKSGLFSLLSRLKHGVAIVALVVGLNFLLGLLPAWLDSVKPIGLFIVACAYPLYYTLGNFKDRTAALEIQSKTRAGSTTGQGEVLGKLAPVRMAQIRNAARDTSSFVSLAEASGVMIKADLSVAPDPWQMMGLTLNDFKTHVFVFGATGTGKTSSLLRPVALKLKTLPEAIGAILTDGKGSLVAEMRALLDIIIEPGTKFGPFQGLTAEMVAQGFAESNGTSMDDKDSIWVKGAGTFHLYALTILEALVFHERARRLDDAGQYLSYEQQVDFFLAQAESYKRSGRNDSEIQAQLTHLVKIIDTTKVHLAKERAYRWTPSAYSILKNILAVPVMAKGGAWRPNDRALGLFEYLGYDPTEERTLINPNSVHPALKDSGRVLSYAIEYFQTTWPNMESEQRSSFLTNVNEDIVGFLKSDRLRGNMIDGKDCGDQSWADTEEGVDVLQVVYGKWLGINLPATQYAHTGMVISKLVKQRIFHAIRERGQKHGDEWEKMTGQTVVMDMTDECQDMVSKSEIDLTAISRSLGLFFVNAAQTFESLDSVMKGDDAKMRFLNNFRTLVSFKSSPKTYSVLQERAGKVKKLKVPVSTQAKIDTSRGIEVYHNSVYADPNHPSAAALRDLDRRGSTRFQIVVKDAKPTLGMHRLTRKVSSDDLDEQNYIPVFTGGEYVEELVLEDWELNSQLAVQGTAVMILNRAGHDRIDFARTKPIFAHEIPTYLAKYKAA